MFLIEPTTALEVGILALQERQRVAGLMRRLRYWVRRGRLNIAVFGPGGTGKSTLGQFLSGKLDIRTASTAYRTSLIMEDYTLEGDLVCSLLVPPGQEQYQIDRVALFRHLAAGKAGGVINVVSYGYHSFEGLSYKDVSLPNVRANGTPEEFFSDYAENRRDREIEFLQLLSPRLRDAPGNIWMVTLVTKQDLWWKEWRQVERYYQEGEYNRIIQQITADRGAVNFTHRYVSGSLIISNLVTGAGELLAPTAEGYDQNIQVANLRNVLDTVTAFAKR